MSRYLTPMVALAVVLAAPVFTVPVFAQETDSKSKTVDIRSSVGDLHVGKDADARKVGLPLYPGARIKSDGEGKDQANLSVVTDAFGMKLIVASYESDDAPAKVIEFYRDKLKKYGKVLECHSQKHGGDIDVGDGEDSKDHKELKCNDDTGPAIELKAGTEDNQHVVAVEPTGKGSSFSLVYLRARGKEADI